MEDQRIFFSYSRNDAAEFALNLAEELRNVNANIWIDQLDIQGGAKWDLEIEKALKASTCVLFIVSEQSVKSDNVLDEVYYALNKKKHVIPIIICYCDIPYRIERLQQIDFVKDYKSGLNRLLKTLNSNKQSRFNETEGISEESWQSKNITQTGIKQQKNIEKPHGIDKADKRKSISGNKFSLTGYDYDIFISYSHLDNTTFNDQEDGWVQQFFNNLQLLLTQRIGSIGTIKIWRNKEKFGDNISLDQTNKNAIKRSAIMLSLISPSYLNSTYCRLEFRAFSQKAQNEHLGLIVGNRSRLINVLLYNIPYEQWPQELSGTAGFCFNNAESTDDLGMPMDVEDPRYRIQLFELSDCIIRLTKEFPKL